ncbi:MAG: YihY/virulence factor BrkB family protein [Pseudomonadota bacterium]
MIRTASRYVHAAVDVYAALDDKNLFLVAAGCAFYGILAIFPAMSAVIALWGLIADAAVVAEQLEQYRAILPVEVFDLINTQAMQLITADTQTLGWAGVLSILVAIWTARAGVAALMRGLNAIYAVPNGAGLGHTVRALFLTAALIGVALVALACVVVAPVVLALMPPEVVRAPYLLAALRWGLAVAVLLAGFALVLRIGPNDSSARPWISAGAVLATVGWTAASYGFSVYLAQFAQYNEIYGSIGAVIALLMWLFLSALLVLLGGALNAALKPVPAA